MLEKYANRCRTYLAVDFEPQVGAELVQAAKEIREKYAPDSVRLAAQTFHFGWPAKRQLCVLSPTRIALQMLGLSAWLDSQADFETMIQNVLHRLCVEKLKRLGFKISAFIPLSMTHSEMCELMFGSFLVANERLAKVCGNPTDPLVQIEGDYDDMQFILCATPMTRDQMTKDVRGTPNLDLFLEDKYLDSGVRDFLERIRQSDSFYFDIDLYRRDVESTALKQFFKSAMENADRIAEACVRNLQSKPIDGK